MEDSKKYLSPVEITLDNYDWRGMRIKDMRDIAYIEVANMIEATNTQKRGATDFAIARGIGQDMELKAPNGKPAAEFWTRSQDSPNPQAILSAQVTRVLPDECCYGVCPCLSLDLESFLSTPHDYDVVTAGKYPTIEIPEYQYPQSRVDSETQQKLFDLYNDGHLKPTGKTFTADHQDFWTADGLFDYLNEYEYDGNFYVLVTPDACKPRMSSRYNYSDGTRFEKNEPFWVKVEPIKWVIDNWDDLPTSINPDGSGLASTLDLRSEDALFVMRMIVDSPNVMYQNSMIRAF